MIILGIETSCDETAAAVVRNGLDILSSEVATQHEFHGPFMGVVPELASRAHVMKVNRVIERALKAARIKAGKLDAIAVTVGPGLAGALLVGRMAAEALGWAHDVPVYGANHIEGHLLSAALADRRLVPPFLGLVVSGGHTELILARNWGDYRLLGRTRDDAAGEAFDKVAKMMGLGYPGGPIIDRLAKRGDASKSPLPKPWVNGTWDFSFSGLKTAVLYKLRTKKSWTAAEKRDICAGFQRSVVDVLVGKAIAAAQLLGLRHIALGGGVAANSLLRSELERAAVLKGLAVTVPSLALCTDNAAMIAASVHFKLKNRPALVPGQLKIDPQLHIPFIEALAAGPVFSASRR